MVEVSVALTDATEKNERFDVEAKLRSDLKNLHLLLIDEKQKVLLTVRNIVNVGMRRIASSVFGEDRKSPGSPSGVIRPLVSNPRWMSALACF